MRLRWLVAGWVAAALAAPRVAEACQGSGAFERWLGDTMVLAAVPLAVIALAAPPRVSLRRAVTLAAVVAAFYWTWLGMEEGQHRSCGRGVFVTGVRSVGLLAGAAHATWLTATLWPTEGTRRVGDVALALVLAPIAAAAGCVVAWKYLGDGYAPSPRWVLGGWLVGVPLFFALEALPLRAVTLRGWLRPKPGCCAGCGYDLRGSPGPACPECGRRMAARGSGGGRGAG